MIFKYFNLSALLFLVFFPGYLYFTGDIYLDFWSEEETFTARTFPYLIGVLGVGVSLLVLVLPNRVESQVTLKTGNLLKVSLLLALTVGYAQFLDLLGFLPTSAIYLFSASALLGERRYVMLTVVSVLLPVMLWLLLGLLGIQLSHGIAADWFLEIMHRPGES